jgi:hypothetical protein
MKKIFIVLFTLLSSVSVAQVTANMSQLSFFAGEWRGKMDWGDIEEYWSEPLGDNMMCTFRCVKNGKALFYEFVLIELKAGVPTMKLRHFNPGSIGRRKTTLTNMCSSSLLPPNAYLKRLIKKRAWVMSASVPINFSRCWSRRRMASWIEQSFCIRNQSRRILKSRGLTTPASLIKNGVAFYHAAWIVT